MTNSISCANCQETHEVTASSIVLPWFCNECVAADQFQQNIQPGLTKLMTTPSILEEHAGLDDADATVENTTLLIEDLELQLSDAKAFSELKSEYIHNLEASQKQSNELLADMSQQLQDDAAELGERDRQIETTNELLTDISTQKCAAITLNETLQQKMSELIDKLNVLRRDAEKRGIKAFFERIALAKYIGNVFQLAAEADEEIRVLKIKLQDETNRRVIEQQVTHNSQRIATLTQEALDQANSELASMTEQKNYWLSRVNYWKNSGKDFRDERNALLNRGFFKRVFNARP